MRPPFEGGCLCGRLRYRIERAPHQADYCHCRMCQRASGAPAVAWLTMASAGFAWTAGEPAVYRSSPGAERLFCPHCGTQLVFREIAEPGSLDVTLASLDDPAAIGLATISGRRVGSPGSMSRTTCRATPRPDRAPQAGTRLSSHRA